MSKLTPWRGILLMLTLLLLSFLAFQGVVYDIFSASHKSTFSSHASQTTNTCNPDGQQRHVQQRFSGSLEENDGWATRSLSEKGGLLWVKHNETYAVTWGISMFHALHCVEMLRAAVSPSAPMPHHAVDDTGPPDDGNDHTHLSHCLDYISQSLMCSGDSTLEPPALKFDSRGNVIEQSVGGHASLHRCKNTAHMWALIEQSEKKPVDPWKYQNGDFVEGVFNKI